MRVIRKKIWPRGGRSWPGAALPVLAAIAGGLVVFATDVRAAECEKLDEVRLQEYAGLIQNIVPWAGIEAGIFEKHCLNAVMVAIPSAPAGFAASVQGGVNFVSTAPETLMVPFSQGMDVKIVAGMNDTIHYGLAVHPDLDLPHEKDGYPAVMQDLVGKRIGVNALGSTTNALARANFLAAGLNPDDATWVAYGAPAAGFAAMQNGTVDAIQIWSDGMEIVQALVGAKIIGDLRDPELKHLPVVQGMRGAALQWAAQTQFIEENEDLVKRFIAANSEAVAWIRDEANYDKVIDIVRRRAPSPEGVADPEALLIERVDKFIPQVSDKIDMSAFQAWAQFAYENDRTPELIDAKDIIWSGSADVIIP